MTTSSSSTAATCSEQNEYTLMRRCSGYATINKLHTKILRLYCSHESYYVQSTKTKLNKWNKLSAHLILKAYRIVQQAANGICNTYDGHRSCGYFVSLLLFVIFPKTYNELNQRKTKQKRSRSSQYIWFNAERTNDKWRFWRGMERNLNEKHKNGQRAKPTATKKKPERNHSNNCRPRKMQSERRSKKQRCADNSVKKRNSWRQWKCKSDRDGEIVIHTLTPSD